MDDFGGKLRQARERRGISLRQIASTTKISAAALDALERNDVTKLPGGIFSRAFVRSYATEVGLDPDETVREFLERFASDTPAPPTAAAVPEEEREFQQRQRQALRLAAVAAALLPILVVALFYAGYRARAASRSRADERPSSAGAAPAVKAPTPAVPASPAAVATTGGPAVPDRLTLEVRPAGDCWLSVTVDGRRQLARIVRAGERQSFTVAREARVEVGDAGAFAYAINGKPGRSLGIKGQVRTLTITPATASQFTR